MEEEGRKMQEEQTAIIKKANEDACKYWKTQADEAAAKKQPAPPFPEGATGAPVRCRPDGTIDDSPAPAATNAAPAPAPAPQATQASAAAVPAAPAAAPKPAPPAASGGKK